MRYAWYTENKEGKRELISIENRPMDINDALDLTKSTKANIAYSYPAFKLKKIQVKYRL